MPKGVKNPVVTTETAKKTRKPINALKVINELRVEEKLPRLTTKPKKAKALKVVVSPEQKILLFKHIVKSLFKSVLNIETTVLDPEIEKKAIQKYTLVLKDIQTGKETFESLGIKIQEKEVAKPSGKIAKKK